MTYQEKDFDEVPRQFQIAPGPPFLSSDRIHDGGAFNMILKDLYLRHRRMKGLSTHYTPTWDAHGLPIERAVGQCPASQFLSSCEALIAKNRQGMARCMGALKLSFDPAFTPQYSTHFLAHHRRCWTLLRTLYERKKVLRTQGYVHSCPQCKTNLTNSQVEYRKLSGVLYRFSFPVVEGPLRGHHLLVETTSPWTLGLNQGVAYNRLLGYGLVHEAGRSCIRHVPQGTLDLATVGYRRPDGGVGRLYAADFVDTRGTGLVHLAPVVAQVDGAVCPSTFTNLGPDLTYPWQQTVVSPKEHPFVPEGTTPLVHRNATCYRCGSVVYTRRTGRELYIDTSGPLIAQAARAINFASEGWRQHFFNWIDNLKDQWCISRPRKFSIPLNLYVSGTDWFVAAVDQPGPEGVVAQGRRLPLTVDRQGRRWSLDGSTFDVWFQSAALVRKAGYALMLEGKDQIRGYFANCHVLSVLLFGRPATDCIVVSPYINQRPGVKLSKSSGHGLSVSPYGSLDPVDFRLYLLGHGWTDLIFDESAARASGRWLRILASGRAFLASLTEQKSSAAALVMANKWLTNKYLALQQAYFRNLDLFRHDQALRELRRFSVEVFSRTFINGFKDLLKNSGRPGAAVALAIADNLLGLAGPFIGEERALTPIDRCDPVGDSWLKIPVGHSRHETLYTQTNLETPREELLALYRSRCSRILTGPERFEGALPGPEPILTGPWTVRYGAPRTSIEGRTIRLTGPGDPREATRAESAIAENAERSLIQLNLLNYDRNTFLTGVDQYTRRKVLEKRLTGAFQALSNGPKPRSMRLTNYVPPCTEWFHQVPHWFTEGFALIVCGKNARRSGELSRKVGPHWYVFHAEGVGGSVYLNDLGGGAQALKVAAALAVLHSDRWNGGPPGRTWVTYGRVSQVTFHVSASEKRCTLYYQKPRRVQVTLHQLYQLRIGTCEGRICYGPTGFALKPGVQDPGQLSKKLGFNYAPAYLARIWPSHACI